MNRRAAIAEPSADEWEVVPQRDGEPTRVAVSLMLKPCRPGLAVKLWLSVSPTLAASLGWERGMAIGLAVGRGRWDGWLRIAPLAGGEGRLLKCIARNGKPGTLHAMLLPPEAIASFEAERMPCEYSADGRALLVRLPWDFAEARAELARAA